MMIDLDLLESAVKKVWYTRTEEEDAAHSHVISELGILDIITSLRQAEKDAARYRWLRESASTENHGGFAYDFRLVDAIRYMPGDAPNETMDIDEAINEAMKCER